MAVVRIGGKARGWLRMPGCHVNWWAGIHGTDNATNKAHQNIFFNCSQEWFYKKSRDFVHVLINLLSLNMQSNDSSVFMDWTSSSVMQYILVSFDLWIRNHQWNRSQIPIDWSGLYTDEATFSVEGEAALMVVGHCLVLQKSTDSTCAKTKVSHL